MLALETNVYMEPAKKTNANVNMDIQENTVMKVIRESDRYLYYYYMYFRRQDSCDKAELQ